MASSETDSNLAGFKKWQFFYLVQEIYVVLHIASHRRSSIESFIS